MITVYIWNEEMPGHASMKITRFGGKTKYYSWWPSGEAAAWNPRGIAKEGSGAGHVRRNPISYGQSHIEPFAAGQSIRRWQTGAHHPGGAYGYNRSDKDMNGGEAAVKFYFRPSSGLDAGAAEAVWQNSMNKSKDEGEYHFLKNSCSTTVLKALKAAAKALDKRAKKAPKEKRELVQRVVEKAIVTPDLVESYCMQLAKVLNDELLLHDGLPPVIARKGGKAGAYVDPANGQAVADFDKAKRHAPHP